MLCDVILEEHAAHIQGLAVEVAPEEGGSMLL